VTHSGTVVEFLQEDFGDDEDFPALAAGWLGVSKSKDQVFLKLNPELGDEPRRWTIQEARSMAERFLAGQPLPTEQWFEVRGNLSRWQTWLYIRPT
jgi:hypothetical protein